MPSLLTDLRRAAKRVGKYDRRGCIPCREKMLAQMRREAEGPAVSIVINTSNEGGRVKATVENFRANLGDLPHEFIVVADGVTDGCCDDLGPNVTVIRNVKPVGCGQAKLQGVAVAKGAVYSFWDAHHAVFTGSIEDLVLAAKAGRRVVNPVTVNMDYTPDWTPRQKNNNYFVPNPEALAISKEQYRQVNAPWLEAAHEPECEFVGVGCTMSRETYKALGGWNRYHGRHGSQERGMGLRAFMAKVPCIVRTDVIVGHEFRKTTPYTKYTLRDQMKNQWHAYAVALSRAAFDAYARPKLMEGHLADKVCSIPDDPQVIADREAFAPLVRRDETELLGRIGWLPKAPSIDVCIPYAADGNLGAEYNRLMERTQSDWVLFLDHDVLLLNPDWFHICTEAVKANPSAGLLTCWTNNIGCKDQLALDAPEGHDIAEHREYARNLWGRHGCAVTPLKRRLISGMFMLVSRAAWQKAGRFPDKGFLGVDNEFHRRVAKAGFPVLRMDGLYVYHIRERKEQTWLDATVPAKPKGRPRCVVYTAITNNYDTLRTPCPSPGWDFVCFTDNPDLRCEGWTIRVLDPEGLSPKRAAVRPRALPHVYLPEYAYSLYCDGNWRLWRPATRLADRHGWPEWLMARGWTGGLSDEVRACKKGRKAPADALDAQLARYLADGMPDDATVNASGMLLRHHAAKPVIDLCEQWWEEYARAETERDQIALAYALWRHKPDFITTCSRTEMTRHFVRKAKHGPAVEALA